MYSIVFYNTIPYAGRRRRPPGPARRPPSPEVQKVWGAATPPSGGSGGQSPPGSLNYSANRMATPMVTPMVTRASLFRYRGLTISFKAFSNLKLCSLQEANNTISALALGPLDLKVFETI